MLILLAACASRPFNSEDTDFAFVFDGLEAQLRITAAIEAETLPDERWIVFDDLFFSLTVPGSPKVTEIAVDGEVLRPREWNDYDYASGSIPDLSLGCARDVLCERVVDITVTRTRDRRTDEGTGWINWNVTTTQPAVTFFPESATVQDITVQVEQLY